MEKVMKNKYKTCVLYHYYEASPEYKDNFLHFMLFGDIEDVDFYIVISGDHTLDLPIKSNFFYFFTNNINHDYGGYSSIFNSDQIIIDNYDYYLFINSSVRGPFYPSYFNQDWTSIFISKLNNEVKIVGSSINILNENGPIGEAYKNKYLSNGPFSHVQTMAFCLHVDTLRFLINNDFFSINEPMSKLDLIINYEILLSQIIIQSGGNISCLLEEYNDIDYRKKHIDINPHSHNGDAIFEGAYFGRTPHPFEVLFIKTNRNLYSSQFLNKLSGSLLHKTTIHSSTCETKSAKEYLKSIEASKNGIDKFTPLQDSLNSKKLSLIIKTVNEILQHP